MNVNIVNDNVGDTFKWQSLYFYIFVIRANQVYIDPSPPQILQVNLFIGTPHPQLTFINGLTTNIVESGTISGVELSKGDKIYMGVCWENIEQQVPATSRLFQVYNTINTCELTITRDSNCAYTNADLSMVNEVLSRQVEAYTNDELRVYSDYFSREDSEPYTSGANGCGGLECLSSGLQIRGALNEAFQKYALKKTLILFSMG